jgi:hypothetical protein
VEDITIRIKKSKQKLRALWNRNRKKKRKATAETVAVNLNQRNRVVGRSVKNAIKCKQHSSIKASQYASHVYFAI